jgi:thioredoxin 1
LRQKQETSILFSSFSAFSRFDPERRDLSQSALSPWPKGSSTGLTAEGLSPSAYFRTSQGEKGHFRMDIAMGVKWMRLGIYMKMACFWILFSFLTGANTHVLAGASFEVPVKGMVTMVDLGAKKCIPCKMMAPILEEVKRKYEGKAAIIFIDVWKYRGEARRFRIRAIPTQIFYDEDGNEVHRHVGFMDEAAIVAQLRKMGVE